MFSNLSETLYSSAKSKNKQAAKIWGLYLKKQRFCDTMQFPEGLENTPFNFECNTERSSTESPSIALGSKLLITNSHFFQGNPQRNQSESRYVFAKIWGPKQGRSDCGSDV